MKKDTVFFAAPTDWLFHCFCAEHCVVGAVFFFVVCGLPCSDRRCMFAYAIVLVLACLNLFVSILVVVVVDDSDDDFYYSVSSQQAVLVVFLSNCQIGLKGLSSSPGKTLGKLATSTTKMVVV